ncbi:SirB1 family protein [Photobacterium sp. 1_MG-2023]|uniref:SirB1 family protein n=1 Tax=Photobacterium sp. 1_MG-2023 TaxID=3062646 RepID=UPI0026E12289|nr:tetratricopeptide repeat protein [Photobacterium sp. 1_MG-2023]MDO6708867.1 tetratricopeptide repeat protein [Photobacterium sp. 1_MG-2023]
MHFTEVSSRNYEAITLVDGAIDIMMDLEPGFPSQWVRLQLDKLVQDAEAALMTETNPHLRLEGLIRLFYHEWGFCGDRNQYYAAENAYLDKVLERRKGIPVSLGAVLMYVAQHLELPVSGVAFPTQYILRVDWPDAPVQFINPFDGEFVSQQTLGSWLKGHKGPLAPWRDSYLTPTSHTDVLARWLTVLKSALLREEQYADALRCSDLALLLRPGDPHEIRDRGYIYQQLECSHAAAMDYSYFIEQCPEDPAAELLKLQVKVLNAQAPVLH